VKAYWLIPLIVVLVLVVSCSNSVNNNLTDDSQKNTDVGINSNSEITPNESSDVDQTVDAVNLAIKADNKILADQYVSDLEKVTDFGGSNYVLVQTIAGDCDSCWDFIYDYDFVSNAGADVVAKQLTIQTQDRKITNVIFH